MDNSNASPSPVNVELHVTTSDILAVADEELQSHRKSIDYIFHDIVDALKKEGFTHSVRASDVAENYGLCLGDVYESACFLARRGMITLQIYACEAMTCRCASCLCRLAHLSLRFTLDIDKQRIIERRQQEAKMEAARAQRQQFFAKESAGFVYLMQAGERFKIGISVNPYKRRDQLNSGQSPFHIEIVHTVQGEGYEQLERDLHEQFANQRVRGEWFEFSADEVAAVIETMNEWATAQTAIRQ